MKEPSHWCLCPREVYQLKRILHKHLVLAQTFLHHVEEWEGKSCVLQISWGGEVWNWSQSVPTITQIAIFRSDRWTWEEVALASTFDWSIHWHLFEGFCWVHEVADDVPAALARIREWIWMMTLWTGGEFVWDKLIVVGMVLEISWRWWVWWWVWWVWRLGRWWAGPKALCMELSKTPFPSSGGLQADNDKLGLIATQSKSCP